MTTPLVDPCPLCGRPLIAGKSVDRHHWVPRRHGGTDWSWVHVICHRMVHELFTPRDLAETFTTPEA
ncbi:MAG: HNH endonuclease, partial [Magnetospiraceae bacterium]